VPAARVSARIGAPASNPNAKQLLMTPENVATSKPRLKLNSAMADRALIGGKFAFFGASRPSDNDDPNQRERDADEGNPATARISQRGDGVMKYGGYQGYQ